FSNPTEDAEVCFVAGTPILMADGTSKPIEEIRPGDMVLSVDHNDPEKDTPKPARVTRFFDNGLKSVVKLTFENQKTGEQFEVVCTPGHRFYVISRGWQHASELKHQEVCISAEGQQIVFISLELISKQQVVYNMEIGTKHTYYIGKQGNNTLVHNAGCWDTIQVIGAGIGGFIVGAGRGVANIVSGTAKTIGEMGCQVIDTGAGIITAGSMLVSDNPVVFEPWSNSLNALDQNNVSTGGYYGNFAANLVTVGVYSEVQASVQLYNGEITVDEASEIIGSTGVLQFVSARAIKGPTPKQSAKTFIDQMSSSEAKRYQKYWNDLKRAPEISTPYDIVASYKNGVRVSYTTYDKFGYRAFQYELSDSVRHGAGYHIYDQTPPAGINGKRPRSTHYPYNFFD
ncbi:MAG: polymorphic toxin-type HINT domain-containing protein, partial [Thermoguttaceae bacterium]|nr:polymorphic toxin-type HINT domain-containing protein [Thermoguttaceae bacterium]